MFYWIYNLPQWQVGGLFALTFLVVTWAATLIFRRYVHHWFHTERRANDMVGFVLSSFSVLYGILLGLIAVAAYQNISALSDVIAKEASSLASIYRDLSGYPEPRRTRLRDELRDYTHNEITRDWPQLKLGFIPSEGTHRLEQFMDDLLAFQPQDRGQQIIHAETLRQINNFLALRTTRLTSVSVGIPEVLWWVVGIGALITLVLLSMLDMEIHVHLILGAALAAFLGLVIFLIAALDNPFRGHALDPGPFENVYQTLMMPNDAVDHAMADLISKAGRLGPPRVEGIMPVAGRDVPDLFFGSTRINNNFDLVDEIAKNDGGVATIFVKSDGSYVRVSTTVKDSDGARAIGSILDPQGPAIQMINRGEAYYGEAIVLGNAFITGYEPIKDAAGNVIGIYSTAYQKQ